MTDLHRYLAQLSSDELERFAQLLREQGAAYNVFPLSCSQQRLWFLDTFAPASAAYHLCATLTLSGALHIPALRASLQELVRRHEILRTVFVTIGGQPFQALEPAGTLLLPTIDLRLPGCDLQAQLCRLAREEARRPFDLAQGPLLRVYLLILGAQTHVLLLTLHHLIADGWSVQIFWRELASLYTAFAAGQPSPLPEPALQYADYAQWQQQWLKSQEYTRQLSYWQRHLANLPPRLALPTTAARPPVQSLQGGQQRFLLTPGLSAALRELSQRAGVTLFMTLLTALSVLLARFSEQSDLCIGVPVFNRPHSELEDVIGFFTNTLVLRPDLSGNPDFLTALRRVRAMALEAFAHQELPFERLVDELQPVRDLSHTPLFQVVFDLAQQAEAPDLPGLCVDMQEVETDSAKFDLVLLMQETPGGLAGKIEYNAALFTPEMIVRLQGCLLTLLEGAVQHPQQRIWALPLLNADQRLHMLRQGNTPEVEYRAPEQIQQQVERRAAEAYDRIALVSEDAQLSYGELERRAEQLAASLRSLGVGPEVLVGVRLERSLTLIIALLAVLKAGGAYVPVNPAYPPARLRFILADTRMPLLLTQADLAWQSAGSPAQTLFLDQPWPVPEAGAGSVRGPRRPEALAYVIYTSGSTGTPRGVLVEHRSVTRLLAATADWFHFGPQDTWTQFHASAFDFSVWEIWGALCSGGRLLMVPEWLTRSPEAFASLLEEQQVTVLNQTPAAFYHLQAAMVRRERRAAAALRLVIFGGEALQVQALQAWLAHIGSTPFINMYGITETTVHVTCYPLGASDISQQTPAPIGRPIPDLQVYLLDRHQQPLPAGVPGEIYVGGAGVSRGYLNHPDLTAGRFLPDPFGGRPGARLYRSGDRAYRRADGALVYCGRTDQQIKVRGFRIEPGEIEAALRQHPAVSEALALAHEERPGEKRLFAYVVPHQGLASEPDAQATLVQELRELLQQRLPFYMVPAVLHVLAALPLTPNGKVDRRALPATAGQPQQDTSAPARSLAEQALAPIWARVLGLRQVGIHDNFFALGGDSILSIQIISRAQAAGWYITPRQLFEYQTVARLARVARRLHPSGARARPAGQVPLTPIQHWFFSLPLPQLHHFNQAVLLTLSSVPQAAHLRQALAAVLRQHDALRLRFTPGGPHGWQQRYSQPQEAGETPLQIVDLAALPAFVQRRCIHTLAGAWQGTLDPVHGPIWHAVLLSCQPQQASRLLLSVHHLVVDGVSWRVLLADLAQALGQAQRGEPLHLPASTDAYQQWAQALLQWAQTPALAQAAPFWQAQAHIQVAPLPRDYPQGENRVEQKAVYTLSLSAQETRLLLHQVPARLSVRIDEALLSALARTLSHWSRSRRVRLTMEGHGRESEVLAASVGGLDLTRTVGWFTTLYPLVLEVAEEQTLPQQVAQLKEQLSRVPHYGLSYGVLRYLGGSGQVRQDLEQGPPAEISVNYLGQVDQDLQETGIVSELAEVPGQVSTRAPRTHLLEVTGLVLEGRLHLQWHYSVQVHRPQTIERVARACLRELQALIASSQQAGPALSLARDAAEAGLTRDELTGLLARLTGEQEPEAILALTPLQEGILYHTLSAPTSGMYIEQFSCLLQGALDIPALRAAWRQVIAATPVLRSAVQWEGLRAPVQVISARAPLPWRDLDWRPLPHSEQTSQFEQVLLADRQQGFALTTAPLMRLTLLHLGERRYRLIWTHHHLLMDGWSVALVLEEVLAAYEALHDGRAPVLQSRMPLRDYLRWLRQQDRQEAQAYWQRALQDLHAPTALPGASRWGSRTRTTQAALPFRHRRIQLSAELSSSIADLARKEQVTLNTVLQGMWALVLSRSARQSRVLFGITVAGRPPHLAGIEHAIGLFINTLPLCVELPGQVQGGAWLRALQHQNLELRQYAHTPLVQIQEWSQIARGLPLFESLLVFENYPERIDLQRGIGGIVPQELTLFERTNYPLTLVINPGERLALQLDCADERFADEDLLHLLARCQQILQALVADPDTLLRLAQEDLHSGAPAGHQEQEDLSAVLSRHPAVQACVVLPGGEQRCDLAYLVLGGHRGHEDKAWEEQRLSEVRDYLRAQRPEAVRFCTFVVLPALPRTPDGRVDRSALPGGPANAEPAPARTAVEERLVQIWAEVLNVERVGIYENFFALGGHSLLAIQIAVRVRAAFPIEIPLPLLLETFTVAEQAGQIEALLARKLEALSEDEARQLLLHL
ncbi:MAG TPA: amino acid adenylation domain-containing protein [Ktedonobacteraceae bacterium]|jgi:amino acid adenylation domain-containing protein/non-ribosomal peptide synthase protein (TIGR01720 family)